MTSARFDGTWEGWRTAARGLLAQGVPPDDVVWSQGDTVLDLFEPTTTAPRQPAPRIPAALIEDARIVACHRDPEPWRALYRLFYRIAQGERHLLQIESDPDVLQFRRMEKAVRRDIHKMHAFVRFRKTVNDGNEEFIAWHRPDHKIVRINAGFFVRRFGSMRWAILTPDESAWWDLETLRFGPGVPRSEAPAADDLEDLWRVYYGSIFNPARVKVAAMTKEMAVRHWATLPEAETISRLLLEANGRVLEMAEKKTPSAAPFVPAKAALPVLREAAATCQGCELYEHATQTVFGDGPPNARVVLVGEQPGDKEDRAGQAFVGPAGQILNDALEQAGIPRAEVYLTNAVKHFKFEERGKRRIHKTPRGIEIAACRPWIEAELHAIRPALVVCMGATAAQSVLGRAVRIQAERGEFMPHHIAKEVLVTVHPSAILRIPDAALAEAERLHFIADLTKAATRLKPSK